MNYLVDTNVLSEPRQRFPNPKTIEWLRRNETNLYTSVLVIGEIRYGIDRLPLGKRRSALEHWLQRLTQIMAGRVLSINLRVAEEWSRLHREIDRKGWVLPAVDLLLAATARRHQLAIATYNVRDFEMTDLQIINPRE